MRPILLVLLLGCDADAVMPDASPGDAPIADSTDAGFDFYGEPCDPPSSLGVVSVCRTDLEYPKAYCTPAGVCRPFCSGACAGHETWAFADTAARVCYCEP